MRLIHKILFCAVFLSFGIDLIAQDLYPKQGPDGKWGYVDKTGKEVVPSKYDDVWNFDEGLAKVQIKGRWGCVDKAGDVVIPFKYDQEFTFSEGLAKVELNGKWGYIDKTGKEVIPLMYGAAVNFSEGLAVVKLCDRFGYIDENGVEYDTYQEAKSKVMCNRLFSDYAKIYAEPKMNRWQKQGEYETAAAWKHRVNKTTRKAEMNKLAKEAEEKFILEAYEKIKINLSLGEYDAASETFTVIDTLFGKKMPVHVPASEAENFRESWAKIKYEPRYGIENDRIAITEINFVLPDGKIYKYTNVSRNVNVKTSATCRPAQLPTGSNRC